MPFDPSQSYGTVSDTSPLIFVQGGTLYRSDTLASVASEVPFVVTTRGSAAAVRQKIAASGIPVFNSPSAFMANNGVLVIGQAPSASATVSFSATSGAGVTMTFSAATLLGTAADVSRVLTILDTTYKYAVITAQSSTTVATVTLTGTLSGLGPFANNAIWLSGTPTTNTTAFSVPLTLAYANCYVALPAGAIAAGIPAAAAVYFCQMATTTVGTIFNNVLSGVPAIPASPTAFVTTGPGAYTGLNGSNQTLISIPVPGGVMGPNGGLIVTCLASNNNSAGTKGQILRYGGGSLISMGNTTNQSILGYREIWNRGVTNSQVATAFANVFGGANANPPILFTRDTTVSQNVDFLVNQSAATDWAAFEHFNIEVIPG